ncbi:urease accessory protein UreF [Breoghania sp. L-A4]|nr:urease accessory protein UreF [Breoghania sp. L-A4]AXS42328.1 urease accessory protein UreF [Breoghania sp. L-A4]
MTEPAALYRLLAWLSPSFPVGAFSYSHGLEWAVEDGTVTNAATLQCWLEDVLRHGSGRSDAILLARAHEAFSDDDLRLCAEIAELAAALQPSRERHLEATAQGSAFLATIEAAWPMQDAAMAERLAALMPPPTPLHHPIGTWTHAVAVGILAAGHGIERAATIHAYLNAFTSNLVSAAIRAVPLGQSDGQRVIAALEPLITEVTREALTAPLDDIGSATFRADIASQRHETQYTRLFRS